jgi:ketosteroid isomerase-like protein
MGVEMPWFPDFASAVELARQQTRAAGRADPVGQYFTALNNRDTVPLEDVWPGEVVVFDPTAGEVRGHRQLRHFVQRSQSLLAEILLSTESVASTVAGNRAVVELLAHVTRDGREQAWPVAVVAESPDDRSVVFRSYFSRWVSDGLRHFRPAFLGPGPDHPGDVVGCYHAALAAGDAEAVVGTFARDGYYREPIGPPFVHHGPDELRAFFSGCFSTGGIALQHCVVTDDSVRCAVEYNCIRWGSHDLPAQAGLAIFERDPDGLLAAVRVYDDVQAPVEQEPAAV